MGELKISTTRLQKLVGMVVKGAGNNRLLPITSTIGVSFEMGELHVRATDTVNTLHVWATNVDGIDSFSGVVNSDLFSKLVAKTTSDFVKISISKNSLKFCGNGTHEIPLLCDEDGQVSFPKDPEFDYVESGHLNLKDVKNIIAVNKASLGVSLDYPQLCAYYCGEKTITTNSNMLCINNVSLFDGNSYLISPETMDLLALCEEETVSYYVGKDNQFVFTGTGFELYSYEHEGFEEYPEEQVLNYLNVEFPAKCSVAKTVLGNVIERLSLFIEPYDRNGAYLTFTPEGLVISSKKNTSEEVIPYIGQTSGMGFRCYADIAMFKKLVNSVSQDTIDIYFGSDSCVKLEAGDAVLILALLTEEAGEF